MSDTFTLDAPQGEPASGVAGVTDDKTLEQAANTEASATSEPEPDDDDGGDEQPQQRQSRAERRISHLAARATNAETQLAEAMQIIRQMAGGQQPTQQQPTQAPRAPQADPLAAIVEQHVGPAPKPEDFPAGEFDPGFRKAETDYIRRSAAVEAQVRISQQLQQAQIATREQHLAANLAQQVAVIEKADPEARTAIAELGMRLGKAGQHGQAVANVIAELGADVAYHIARNPEVEARLRSVPVPVALIELGELRATLKARTATPVVQPTSAPNPPPRLRGGGGNTVDLDRIPMSQFAAIVSKEVTHRG